MEADPIRQFQFLHDLQTAPVIYPIRQGRPGKRYPWGQHHRMAGLNLLAAAGIRWNTRQLGRIVGELAAAGQPSDPALLAHVSPLGWEHILLTGEYRWRAKT